MTEKASFLHAEESGRFQFHTADGRAVIVHGDKPLVTSDPAMIAFLDAQPGVKRVEKKAA